MKSLGLKLHYLNHYTNNKKPHGSILMKLPFIALIPQEESYEN